jgi:hypothetical protein
MRALAEGKYLAFVIQHHSEAVTALGLNCPIPNLIAKGLQLVVVAITLAVHAQLPFLTQSSHHNLPGLCQ